MWSVGDRWSPSTFRKLHVLAAGLVMLVLALAPLHMHASSAEPADACLICHAGNRALDLPAAGPSLQVVAALEVELSPTILSAQPPRGDLCRSPRIPRAPPQVS